MTAAKPPAAGLAPAAALTAVAFAPGAAFSASDQIAVKAAGLPC